MRAGERLYDSQGNEVCLFPLENLHLSQGEHHLLAMDFLGWGSSGRIYNCPCYAPFSGRVVYTGQDHNMIYWSTNPVRLVNGSLSHVSILVAHSMTAPAGVGSTFTQGQLWYHTGNYGQSTGDHLHLEVALGHVMWDSTGQHLNNPAHLYNVMAVNDTTISAGMGYNWRDYEGGHPGPGPTPGVSGESQFPWVLYARKLRAKKKMNKLKKY